MRSSHHPLDSLINGFDQALRVVAGVASASRPTPAAAVGEVQLEPAARRHSAGLMRVDHVGEVCAQALYHSQARFAMSDAVRQQCQLAAREEEDHLAWTAERLAQLNSRTSWLNPLWYAGAYAMGTLAAHLGDAHSMGFVVETERQVESHLAGHLARLPVNDGKSRAIVEQMRQDEVAHGAAAGALGATQLPRAVQLAMAAMAKVMTGTAYYI